MTVAQLNKIHSWNIPEVCPCCGSQTEVNESGMVFCPNKSCSQKVVHKILKMTDTWKVKEFGEAIVTDLVNNAKITGLAECINEVRNATELQTICGKNADKIIKNVNTALSTAMPFERFLAAFDLEGFGESKIKTLVDAGYSSIDSIKSMNPAKVGEIFGWTETSAKDFLDVFMSNLDDINATLPLVTIAAKVTGFLSGLSFCFTGPDDAKGAKRPALEAKIESMGATASSVKKGLSYLVSSEKGTGKMEKAEKLGIKIISYADFYKLIGE